MGQDFFWLNHELKLKVFVGRDYSEEKLLEAKQVFETFFFFVEEDDAFLDFADAFSVKRVCSDLVVDDFLKLGAYLLVLRKLKSADRQSFLVLILDEALGVGEVIGDYDSRFEEFEDYKLTGGEDG